MLTFPFGPLRGEPDFSVPTLNSFTWTEFESGMVVYAFVYKSCFHLSQLYAAPAVLIYGLQLSVYAYVIGLPRFNSGSGSCSVVQIFHFHDLTVKLPSVIRDCRNFVTKLARRGEHVGSLRIRRASHAHCWKHLEESLAEDISGQNRCIPDSMLEKKTFRNQVHPHPNQYETLRLLHGSLLEVKTKL